MDSSEKYYQEQMEILENKKLKNIIKHINEILSKFIDIKGKNNLQLSKRIYINKINNILINYGVDKNYDETVLKAYENAIKEIENS